MKFGVSSDGQQQQLIIIIIIIIIIMQRFTRRVGHKDRESQAREPL